MSKWDYGNYAEKYNMDGIIEIGTGQVKVHNLFDPLPEFMKEADLLFCDPPCSKGNINSFYTKAERTDYQESYIPFFNRFWECVEDINPKKIVLELFASNKEMMMQEIKKRYNNYKLYECTYYHKAQNKDYIVIASNDNLIDYPFNGMDEQDVIEWICKNENYNCIADPCMGRGLVGFYANKYAKKFAGTELNKNRLAVLLERINKGKLIK